jgi:hypothetical protein
MELHYDNIVVGHSIEAVLYSYLNEYPIVVTSTNSPYPFEVVNFELPNFFGRKKNEIWSLLLFELSMKGLAPFSKNATSLRIEEKKISLFLKQTDKVIISFKKCYIFDNDKVICDNIILKKEEPKYMVLDWFNVRSGASHDVEVINTEDDFVKDVYFYNSVRIDGDRGLKDLVSISYMDDEQLNNFDYSDTVARFKIESLMREKGILGSKSGFDGNGKQKRFPIKIEANFREVRPISKVYYKNSKSIKFINMSAGEIVAKYGR